jgi:hypothetical protein
MEPIKTANNDQYDQGMKDFEDGVEYLANPYANPLARKDSYSAWQAGWTYAWQQKKLKEGK